MKHGQRGFTMVEILVSLLILALIVTTSLGIFYDRSARLRRAEQTIFAWQVLGDEAEYLRHVEYAGLTVTTALPFQTGQKLLARLPNAKATLSIEQTAPDVKTAHLSIIWEGKSSPVTVDVIRTDTGGSNLW
ncbi:MAG: type II secretion system protein [Thermoanaerobaculia bacterium]